MDRLLDDPIFIQPFHAHFHPVSGRPSIPIHTYLRLMFLKHRYGLGYELLCREVTDSISWQRFCRIPLGGQGPHPTTLVKLTRRVGEQTVDRLNQALLARARARQAAVVWVVAAAAFVVLLVAPAFDDRVLQVEVAYVAAALVLCALLYALYRRD